MAIFYRLGPKIPTLEPRQYEAREDSKPLKGWATRPSNNAFPPPECANIIWFQFEPLTVNAFVGEPPVPIVFDTRRVIRFDAMNRSRRQCHRSF
jgi:hypothetical protein